MRLQDLLDEAVERAETDLRSRLKEEERSESEAFIQHVAGTVGLAAVKYADLSQNRITNYQFSFDRMLALQGNTAPYLLYAVVRIAGIAARGATGCAADLAVQRAPGVGPGAGVLKFDAVIAEVEEELVPNRLCSYLFDAVIATTKCRCSRPGRGAAFAPGPVSPHCGHRQGWPRSARHYHPGSGCNGSMAQPPNPVLADRPGRSAG